MVQTLIDSNLFEEQLLTVSDVTEAELLGASEAVIEAGAVGGSRYCIKPAPLVPYYYLEPGLGSLAYLNVQKFDFEFSVVAFIPKPCCFRLVSTSLSKRHLDWVGLEPLHFVIED